MRMYTQHEHLKPPSVRHTHYKGSYTRENNNTNLVCDNIAYILYIVYCYCILVEIQVFDLSQIPLYDFFI